MKNKIVAFLCVILVLAGCVAGAFYYLENHDEFYYAVVDNTKVEELSANEDMKYRYTLKCYNKNGHKKTLKFKTSRKLKEGAYISLEVRALGVHKWEEVNYNDMPAKVREKIR